MFILAPCLLMRNHEFRVYAIELLQMIESVPCLCMNGVSCAAMMVGAAQGEAKEAKEAKVAKEAKGEKGSPLCV